MCARVQPAVSGLSEEFAQQVVGHNVDAGLPDSVRAGNTTLRVTTTLGDIDIELFDSLRPLSVNNFLNYVSDGDFANSFIHRSVPGFVIQGGGFTVEENLLGSVPTDPPIQDTPGPTNLRGTLAMAESDPDMNPATPGFATSQWFINLVDNPGLDAEFTVFGQVTSGMDVVDAIAGVPTFDASSLHSAFTNLPLINYTSPNPVQSSNLIFTTIPEPSGGLLGSAALATSAALSRLRRQR